MAESDQASRDPTYSIVRTAEGSGCIATTLPATANPPPGEAVLAIPSEPDSGGADSAPCPGPARRPLKLVVTLHPSENGSYRASLAVGSPDCDPVFRAIEVADVLAALTAAVTLLADAAAQWETQPRYPSVRPLTRAGSSPESTGSTRQENSAGAVAPSVVQGSPGSVTVPARSAGQLPLFG
jgi:hypothetical protein